MKRICKPLVAVILVFSLIGSLFSVQISAAKNILNEIPTVYEIEKWYNQQPIPKTNSEYVKYLQDVENGDISPYGDIIPTSRPIVSDDTISNLQTARAATLPPQYYPSDYNNVTSVKDQGEEGLCWAYAAVSTIESFLIKNHNIERDYSENYYNYYFATDAFDGIQNPYALSLSYGDSRVLGGGGHALNVFRAMLSGVGPVLETQFFKKTGHILPEELNIPADRILLGYGHINSIPITGDISSKIIEIKNAIADSGAVTFSFHAPVTKGEEAEDLEDIAEYYFPQIHSFYINASNPKGYKSNHTVSLVGWDDAYLPYSFDGDNPPPGRGAFIIKNSWGEDSGDNGYYYISYYDYFIYTSDMLYATSMDAQSAFSDAYASTKNDYDTPQEFRGDTAWFANVFNYDRDYYQYISEVAFEAPYNYTSYEVYISPTGEYSNEDTYIKAGEGTTTASGFQTVSLTTPVVIPQESSKFAVIIKIQIRNNSLVIPFYPTYDYKGAFYWKTDDQSWSIENKTTATDIRAYFKNDSRATGIAINGNKSITMIQGGDLILNATVSPAEAKQTIQWSSSNKDVATVDPSTGIVTAVGSGTAIITARSVDGGFTDTCTITVDDAGDYFGSCSEIPCTAGLLNSQTLCFEYSGDLDMYKFKAPSTGQYVIYSSDGEFDTNAWLYNSAQNLVDTCKKQDGSNKFEFTVDLVADQYYYLLVSADNSSNIGSYIFNLAPIGGAFGSSVETLTIGQERQLTISENYATDSAISFTSSNPAVATVDASGRVTGVSGGSVTITAESADGLYSASCTVRVDEYGNEFNNAFSWQNLSYTSVNSQSGGIQYGTDCDVFEFTAPVNGNYIFYFSNLTQSTQMFLYHFMGGEYYPVNVEGHRSFGAYMSAGEKYYLKVNTLNNLTYDYQVNINYCIPVSDIELNTDAVQLMVGGHYSLQATIFPANAYDKSVTWSTTNSNVVTVSDEGVLTGIACGSANIMATASNGDAYVCTVTVDSYDDTEIVVADGTYRIQNYNSSLYMEGATSLGANNLPYTTLNQQASKENDNSQIWTIKNTGDGYCTIEAAYKPGFYLTAAGMNNTNCVLNYDLTLFEQSNDAQRWKIVQNPNGSYRILSKAYPGYAVAVFAASTLPNENLVMFEDNQTSNAYWSITSVERVVLSDGVYTFHNVNSGLALDVLGQTVSEGLGLMQETVSDSTKQRWLLIHVADGYYTIASVDAPTLYLKAISDAAVKMGSKTDSPDDSTLWAVMTNPDGSYRISPKAYPNKTAVVVGALDFAGVEIILYEDNLSTNGCWYLNCERVMKDISGTYYIANRHSGKFLFMDGDSYSDVIQTSDYSYFPWNVTCDENNYFTMSCTYKLERFVAVVSADGETVTFDVVLDTTEPHGGTDELWFVDGAGRIHSALYPNKVLAVENDSLEGGASIVLVDANSCESENWEFVQVES